MSLAFASGDSHSTHPVSLDIELAVATHELAGKYLFGDVSWRTVAAMLVTLRSSSFRGEVGVCLDFASTPERRIPVW